MTAIALDDLNLALELDRAAMHRVNGGYTYTGSTTTSGSWSFLNQWTSSGGFKTIGFIKYKVDRLHKRYQRTQYRTDNYEQLTLVIG